ncbi:MAG: endonuclease III domain-containing protein [Clostridia bacterium]|nr:endonuclease III domain-containing protein [Clostridia bacterium]
MKKKDLLLKIYERLLNHFGHRNWWPGDTKWEIIIGAILTQNVSWKNVEKAILNLKNARCFEPADIYRAPLEEIAELIRPSRYYNMKAKKLKAMAGHIIEKYQGNVDAFLKREKGLENLRKEVLSIWGIGPETADSILLYAGELPTFVVDAYTKRIFSRLGLLSETAGYDEMRSFFMNNLPPDRELFNDYHAQIVALGHNICKNVPRCEICPLKEI